MEQFERLPPTFALAAPGTGRGARERRSSLSPTHLPTLRIDNSCAVLVLRVLQQEHYAMGGFGGMDEIAPLADLFSCSVLMSTSMDDPTHIHHKGLLAIYKPSTVAQELLGAPSPFGSANVKIFHVTAFQALQYLSCDQRPTTVLLEMGNNHTCGFVGPKGEVPLSRISPASLKPLQTSDSNLSLLHAPLREVYSKLKELQTEGSQACKADIAWRRAGLEDARAELKRVRKAALRLLAGQATGSSSRKSPARTSHAREQEVDGSMSVLYAQSGVRRWLKLCNQDNFKRPWPVHRRDARERPGASLLASDDESESDDSVDDSGDGAGSSNKKGKEGGASAKRESGWSNQPASSRSASSRAPSCRLA